MAAETSPPPSLPSTTREIYLSPPPPPAIFQLPPPSTGAENVRPPPPTLMELSWRGVRTMFLPYIHNLNSTSSAPSSGLRELLVLVNFRNRTMTVLEYAGLIEEILGGKCGAKPASKASIEAMRSVEVEEFECSICLDERVGEGGLLVKEMPCKHLFHSACIEKWLGIHGSCPMCRFRMPVEGREGMGGNANVESGDGTISGGDGDGGVDGDDGPRFVLHIYARR